MASESASTGTWAKESAARIVGTGVVGGGLAVATFFLSDVALPDDAQWWVRWAMAGASFVSYAIGVTAAVSLLRSKLEGRVFAQLEDANARIAELEAESRHDEVRLQELEIQRAREADERARQNARHERERVEAENVHRLATLPAPLRSLLKEVYDGELVEVPFSNRAAALIEAGVLQDLSHVSSPLELMVAPNARVIIERHYDEVFGAYDAGRRRKDVRK